MLDLTTLKLVSLNLVVKSNFSYAGTRELVHLQLIIDRGDRILVIPRDRDAYLDVANGRVKFKLGFRGGRSAIENEQISSLEIGQN